MRFILASLSFATVALIGATTASAEARDSDGDVISVIYQDGSNWATEWVLNTVETNAVANTNTTVGRQGGVQALNTVVWSNQRVWSNQGVRAKAGSRVNPNAFLLD